MSPLACVRVWHLFPLIALAMASIVGMSSVSAAAGTDGVTGLRLYPGLPSADITKNVAMCGSAKGNMAVYSPIAKLATVDRWFASHLPGFSRMAARTDRPQIYFYQPGRKLMIGITGDPTDAGVHAITYYALSKPPVFGPTHLLGC